MTVQQLINQLQQLAHKEADIVGEWDAAYSIIHSITWDDAQETYVMDVDDWGSYHDKRMD